MLSDMPIKDVLMKQALKQRCFAPKALDLWDSKYSRINIKSENTDELVIEVSGPIMWFYEQDAMVAEALKAAGPDAPVRVNINSPGGDVHEAIAMRSRFMDHKGKVTMHVRGLAASAAQFLTLGGDEVLMAHGSQMMIHRPAAFVMDYGNYDELKVRNSSILQALSQVENDLIRDLARKTGLDVKAVAELLAAETWYTAEDAVENGLADAVSPTLAQEEDEEEEELDEELFETLMHALQRTSSEMRAEV